MHCINRINIQTERLEIYIPWISKTISVYLKCVFIWIGVIFSLVSWCVGHISIISAPCYSWPGVSRDNGFEKGKFAWKKWDNFRERFKFLPFYHSEYSTCLWCLIEIIKYHSEIFELPDLPSWIVNAIGLRVKSGWLFPSGRVSINCVIITPGTLDFFLMPTASIGKRNVTNTTIARQFPEKQYSYL